MEQNNKKLPVKDPQNPKVYVGPNMGRDILITQFSVFKNGLPSPVKDLCESDKNFASLFIPVTELGIARQNLRKSSSHLAKAFRAVFEKYIQEGGYLNGL